ncbi:hypothetical protein F1721_04100 [Saccharopolyspora hirsuta]|uniref:Uncharacterized protein n=1 Tax=Saccharopolyspora hirsuta TaxID=1837 RepID=A0A5M7CF04_SACHI|nr:hypothetical protein [Saccharopolyspora hirsuta]KAA5837015.1 hypothetical protein F1721_04100 [Saccharopolyspora hirsuta]
MIARSGRLYALGNPLLFVMDLLGGRGAADDRPFRWTYYFCWGIDDIATPVGYRAPAADFNRRITEFLAGDVQVVTSAATGAVPRAGSAVGAAAAGGWRTCCSRSPRTAQPPPTDPASVAAAIVTRPPVLRQDSDLEPLRWPGGEHRRRLIR